MSSIPCKVLGCTSGKHEALGYCKKHYVRFKQGRPLVYANDSGRCSVSPCPEKPHAKGFCYRHYLRHWSGSEVDRPRVDNDRFKGRSCLISDCSNSAGGRTGLCKSHSNWASKYRFSPAQAVQILNSGYGCAICGDVIGPLSVNIDHDHNCCPGQSTCGSCTRGILCRACNRAIGSFRENLDILRTAVRYLSGDS